MLVKAVPKHSPSPVLAHRIALHLDAMSVVDQPVLLPEQLLRQMRMLLLLQVKLGEVGHGQHGRCSPSSGIRFRIVPECRSESFRNRAHLAPDSPGMPQSTSVVEEVSSVGSRMSLSERLRRKWLPPLRSANRSRRPTSTYPLPSRGRVNFYFLTDAGTLFASGPQENVGSPRDRFIQALRCGSEGDH